MELAGGSHFSLHTDSKAEAWEGFVVGLFAGSQSRGWFFPIASSLSSSPCEAASRESSACGLTIPKPLAE